MLKRIRMDLTDNCNLRCQICTIHDYHRKTEVQYLPFDVFRKSCQGFLAGLKYVQIGNIAEPLLHPCLDQFLEFIRSESDAEIQIQTNGTLLRKYLEEINLNRCTLNVSLDSLDRETYERIRMGARLDRVIQNLEQVNLDRVKVLITPTWMLSNVGEYEDFVEFCRRRKFQLSGPLMCIRESRGIILKNNIDESLWFHKGVILDWKKKIFGCSTDPGGLARLFAPENSGKSSSFSCSAHHDDLMILADGTCNLCFQKSIGNLSQNSLREIWQGKEAESFRKSIDEKTSRVCEECDYRSICLNPFIENFRNHVSSGIYSCIPVEIKERLTFESPWSDEEQKAALIEALGHSFKIIQIDRQKDGFLAVPIAYEGLNRSEKQSWSPQKIFSAPTKWELEGLIINEAQTSPSASIPRLLGSYKGYNLVEYLNLIYAAPLSSGPLDLKNKEKLNYPGMIVAATRGEAQKQIDQISAQPSDRAEKEERPELGRKLGGEPQGGGSPRKELPTGSNSRQGNRSGKAVGLPLVRYSFLLPTRKRVEMVHRFFESIATTTRKIEDLEVVLALDEDDLESLKIADEKLNLKKVVLPKGKAMGALNRACFEASSGRYVMLVNDDIVIRTKGWDQVVSAAFASFPDDIVLIHVNDLLFREKLCTFPFLSRRACLEIGICPEDYQRYRIDDHIYDIYNMLAYLGHRRILYLPDVIFEHENHTHEKPNAKGQIFKSQDDKIYLPNQAIIEQDARLFDSKMEERKQAAFRLARLIDEDRRAIRHKKQENTYVHLLNQIQDPFGYRRTDFVRRFVLSEKSQFNPQTTIAVVTADIRREYAAQCISLIKKYTRNYELLVLDNSKSKDFSHPREMNKVLRNIETDYLVLMDDDVLVEEGWLEGLLKCLDEKTGVVAPLHKDMNGMLSFSGAYLAGDGRGTHEHTIDRPPAPREMQVYCSAILLIDLKKCGHILMDETYRKYFFDLVHGLEVWEAGYKAICTPEVVVTHLGGATMNWGSREANELLKRDQAVFIEQWVKSGRLAKLEQGIWQQYPYLKSLVEIPQRIKRIGDCAESLELDSFREETQILLTASRSYGLFKKALEAKLHLCARIMGNRGDWQKEKVCKEALNELKKIKREENWMQGTNRQKQPLLSALVSAYKSERFMRGLLEDLENQTIADQLEIVIVDSNSPENEAAIIREFQRRYDNIVYLRTPERENSHVSINRCIQLARGKYLSLANVDDRHRRDALERMVEALEAHPDVALVYADVAITDRENEYFENAHVRGYYRWPDFDQRLLFQISYIGSQPVWRRELHDRYGYFDPEFWVSGDYEFWLRLVAKEKFLHLPEVLGLYYLSAHSNEHQNMSLSFQESEKAREKYWPKEWGQRPTPFYNKNPFAYPASPYPGGGASKDQVVHLKQQGVHFYNQGDRMGAKNSFRLALAMDPRDPDVLVSLGKIEFESQNFPEALSLLQKAIQENPEDKEAYIGLAMTALKLDDISTCQVAYDKARLLDPFHPALKPLGDFLAKRQKKIPPRGISTEPSKYPDPQSFNDRGEFFFCEGKMEQAREQFQKSLEIDPAYLPAINNLGVLSFQEGRVAEAREYFNRCLTVNPHFQEAIDNLEECRRTENKTGREIQSR